MSQLRLKRIKAKQKDKPKPKVGKKKSEKQQNFNSKLSTSNISDQENIPSPQLDDDLIEERLRDLGEKSKEIIPKNQLIPNEGDNDGDSPFTLQELEKELEDDDSPFTLEKTDTNWADDVIKDDSIDASTPEGIEIIQDAIEGLLFNLELNQALAPAMQQELEERGKLIKQLAPKEIEDIVNTFEKAEQINEIISRPIGPQVEVDEQDLLDISEESIEPELEALQLELQESDIPIAAQFAQFLEQMSEENVDRILQIEEDFVYLEEQNKIIYQQIRQLQEKLGILREDETRSKISFQNEQRLKKVAKTGLVAAKFAAPVTEVPIKIAQTSIAVISLAKTIKHIRNMKNMLATVNNLQVKRIISYTINQKTKKAAKKGLTAAQLGIVPTSYSVGRAIYKTVKKTKGKERETNAKSLHDLAIKGDLEAAALIKELVGSGNIVAALDQQAGWQIVKEKLASQ